MAEHDTAPSDELLKKVDGIAWMKEMLPFAERAEVSRIGLFVQSRQLSGERRQIMAGGRFRPNLEFIKHPNGTTTVSKYRPGPWESKVEETLEFVAKLYERVAGLPSGTMLGK